MSSAKLRPSGTQPQGKKMVAKRAPAKRVRVAPARGEPTTAAKGVIAYRSTKGVDDYVRQVARATPLQLVEIERQGVLGSFIKDLSKRMEIPSSRIFTILGVPKATAEKKAAAGERVEGSGGQAAIGMVRLLGIAQEIVANSTAREAKTFDATKWLGQWIERPQRALGGRKPAELMDTPTGTELVSRLLGSIESGAYQ
ncbi:MAG TPA: antitoxin Xre/MbcA/ParS toxin-binding domain-containing protein [Casimicrobiaceae bacterium]|jgi:putative toxin-antitoxin system antitoxin component (TIGR02293 family)